MDIPDYAFASPPRALSGGRRGSAIFSPGLQDGASPLWEHLSSPGLAMQQLTSPGGGLPPLDEAPIAVPFLGRSARCVGPRWSDAGAGARGFYPRLHFTTTTPPHPPPRAPHPTPRPGAPSLPPLQ